MKRSWRLGRRGSLCSRGGRLEETLNPWWTAHNEVVRTQSDAMTITTFEVAVNRHQEL